ncbi:MAG: FimV/HubP family polar landmark protein [Gammaproteobacteria bacterium]
MKLRLQAVFLLILLMLSGSALGLGVGRLEQNSALNEIFDARIPLLSSSPDELASLKVRLADSEAFDRAGIERNAAVNLLKFDIVEPASGEDYIHVTSRDPIREPFLSFLLEISWSSGRLFREYTVLLDPPAYEPQSRQTAAPATPRQTRAPAAPTPTESRYSHEVQYPDASPASPATAPRTAAPRIDGDYGPTRTGDTLWSIANSMRPSGVSNQQMMLALLRANPDAFIGNNVNGLKRGQVLRAPDSDEMRTMDSAAALEEIKRQHSLWNQTREAVAASPAQQPDMATAAPAATSPARIEAETTESRLEVLAAADGESDTSSDAAADDADLNRDLAIASENLEAVAQENAELKDRLAENEALIEDLKRLIALKDDELASLQSQVARNAAGVAAADAEPEAAAETEAAAAEEAEAEAMVAAEEAEARAAAMAAQQAEQEAELQAAEEQAEMEAAEQAEAEAAMADDELDEAPAAAPGDSILDKATGILDKVMGILGAAVGFVMGNLMLVGAALLALLVLIGGGMFMSRRSAEKNDAGAAGLGEDEFPDFAAGMSADQTSFDDEESVTEINAAADDAELATEISGMAAEQAPEDDGFEIPVSEGSGQFEAPEEDPLAEVNVLMAYEHFDQAEEFVRNRLKSEPDDIESHAKLLEVFYASNNKKKYEDAAAKLKELTGGEGEHWDMAVAMWQEISPNRALFEAGGPEEDDAVAAQPASAGIVDITGDSTGDVTPALSGDDGGLDFDFSDSAAGAASTSDDSGADDILDLTAASGEEDDGDMLDLTAASGEAETDDNMLEMTAASAPAEELGDDNSLEMTAASVPPEEQEDDNSLEMTVSISKTETDDDLGLLDITASADDEEQSEAVTATGSEPVAEDDALDLSFDTSNESDDLLDVTREGSLESEEDSGDLLDVTSSMKSAPEVADDLDVELSDDSSDADDGMSLDFSLDDDDDKPKAEASASAGTAATDDSMLDFDMEFSSTGTESESADAGDADEAQSLEDLGALDDIGAELDKLEESMGMLSADETKAGFGDTSDALEGIDDALGDMDKESSADATKAGFGNTSDALEGIDDALGDMDSESNDDMDLSDLATGLESELDSLGADDDASTESTDEADDDLAALSIELEDSDSDSDSSGGDLTSDLDAMLSTDAADDSADEGLSIDLDSDADAGDDELNFDMDSDLSADLDSDLSSDLETDLDAGPAGAADDDLSLDTLQADVEASADDDDGFSFDIDTSDSGSGGSDMDMDSTVEMPKDRLATSQLVLDEDDGDDRTVFVPRSSKTDEQSLEDELTTKLDLAKAYVELGDSDSARGILQEVMDQGNDKQKQEAGELLQQLG